VTSLTYRDADGAPHEVAVRQTASGDWQVLDTCAAETRVIQTLDGPDDGRLQAEAIARDYVTAGRFTAWAGRAPGQPIPEQGGADADSDRRPRPGPRQPQEARQAALPHPAG
jgi:hypothetical protein